MLPKCCICGRSVTSGSMWNGNTDKEYCYNCGKLHFFDGDNSDGDGE